MKLALVSRHLPSSEGTAAGRVLSATVEGLRDEACDVTVWSWGPEPPHHDLPRGCAWSPLPDEPRLVNRLWSIARPRDETARAGWRPPEGALAVADDPLSFGAVRRFPPAVATVHFLTRLDAPVIGDRHPRIIQQRREERRVARRAALLLTYSERVASALGRGIVVPVAFPMPTHALRPSPEPVAVLVANWAWAPNRVAAASLLRMWHDVRTRVPRARLVLAGRSAEALGGTNRSLPDGVELRGPVPRSDDVLREAAVVAFPSPPTSGPKVKVLEAFASGLPVVTTEAGVEGVDASVRGHAVVVHELDRFAEALAQLLSEPDRRRELGSLGREAFAKVHSPRAAARTRLAALAQVQA